MTTEPMIRSIWWAASIPGAPEPWRTAHLRVFYPAAPTWSVEERMSGVLAPDRSQGALPVVLVMPGVNVGQDVYRWLAVRLASAGFAVATYDLVAELFPGQYGASPGLDIGAASPEAFGSRPTGSAIRPLLDALAEANAAAPLEGLLDLTRVVLLGHSGGGSVALQSASPAWFPEVKAVVGYAAHLGASTVLGWPAGAIAPSPATAPVLLVAGTRDGVVEASAMRYVEGGPAEGVEADAAEQGLMARTFDEGLASASDAVLVMLADGTHFSFADPIDTTSARSFLDHDYPGDEAGMRDAIAGITIDFLQAHVLGDPGARERLDRDLGAPRAEVSAVRRRTAALTGRQQ